MVTSTAAGRLLQARALQCSFSSVYHLRSVGINPKEATFIETMFTCMVAVPIAFMATTGYYYYIIGGQPQQPVVSRQITKNTPLNSQSQVDETKPKKEQQQ